MALFWHVTSVVECKEFDTGTLKLLSSGNARSNNRKNLVLSLEGRFTISKPCIDLPSHLVLWLKATITLVEVNWNILLTSCLFMFGSENEHRVQGYRVPTHFIE